MSRERVIIIVGCVLLYALIAYFGIRKIIRDKKPETRKCYGALYTATEKNTVHGFYLYYWEGDDDVIDPSSVMREAGKTRKFVKQGANEVPVSECQKYAE